MKPIVYNFPADDRDGICASQNVVNNTAMTINGALAGVVYSTVPPILSSPAVILSDIKRNVTVYSANNLTGISFSVVGLRDGFSVNDTIAGGNNTTVQGTTLFDTILSITPSNNANAVEIGTGIIGQTNWFNSDYNLEYPTLTVAVSRTGNITYSFITTLMDVTTVAPASIVSFSPVTSLTAINNANAIGTYTGAARYSSLSITTGAAGATMQAIFLQQGLNS